MFGGAELAIRAGLRDDSLDRFKSDKIFGGLVAKSYVTINKESDLK
jgi:hypothetical protein